MYKLSELMFLYTETSLHAGAGTGVGRIDLPIQREKHTYFPKIESSSLKGALREALFSKARTTDRLQVETPSMRAIFGSAESENSGALALTDARLLFFPIRSAKGIFAWVTCPQVIRQFLHDQKMVSDTRFENVTVPEIENEEIVLTTTDGDGLTVDGRVMLEEFVFNRQAVDETTQSFLQNLADLFLDHTDLLNLFKTHVAIVHDDVFASFVTLYTEVITRNKINNNTGTVEAGALFTEEYLPPHSVLYSLLLASGEFSTSEDRLSAEKILTKFHDTFTQGFVFQAGGNRTIGKGLLRMSFGNQQSTATS